MVTHDERLIVYCDKVYVMKDGIFNGKNRKLKKHRITEREEEMMDSIKLYFDIFVRSLVDIVWLGVLSKNIYSKYLGHLMAPTVNWVAALIFYLLFIGGLVFFVVHPAL